MADEHQFIRNGLQRSQIDEFFAQELERAGYGGMDVAKTPMGTQIVLRAEKPGMVIGKGGKNIRKVTAELEERFELDDPQIDVQEVDEPDLNARIVADRLANALERGWYFRKAGHTTIDRIMDSGALGAEIVLSGKVTGARSRVEKFNRGYIKHNGEPADEIVDVGQSVAVMKLGTIGVTVKIIPPEAELPDDFRIREDVDPDRFAPTPAEAEAEGGAPAEVDAGAGGVEELLAEEVGGDEAAVADEEVVAVEPDEDGETADAAEAEAEVEADADAEAEAEAEAEADDEPSSAPDVDEDIEAEAARIVAQMEEEEEGDS